MGMEFPDGQLPQGIRKEKLLVPVRQILPDRHNVTVNVAVMTFVPQHVDVPLGMFISAI